MATQTTTNGMFTTSTIFASETELPEEIEVLQENNWKDMPDRPDFSVSAADLDDYVNNFKSNIRAGVPIDIEHRESKTFGEQAAGWVKDVYTKVKDNGKKSLFVKPEWNSLGKELVGDKRFRFVSAEFNPKSLGGYTDPEGKGKFSNVLKAVTITNRPLMKDLPAIMASEDNESTSALTIQFSPGIINPNQGAKLVDLNAIRGKDVSALSQEEKSFLTEHKTDLSAAEQTKFGLAEAPAEPVKASEDSVTIKASELAELREKAGKVEGFEDRMSKLEAAANAGVKASEELALTKAHAVVDEHIKRGAIKSDQRDFWSGQLITASEEARTKMEAALKDLSGNTILATDMAGDGSATAGAGATKQLMEKAEETVKASEGKTDFTTALLSARAANPDLAKEADAEAANGERVVA